MLKPVKRETRGILNRYPKIEQFLEAVYKDRWDAVSTEQQGWKMRSSELIEMLPEVPTARLQKQEAEWLVNFLREYEEFKKGGKK